MKTVHDSSGDYPIGGILSFAGNVPPGSAWILCDGRPLPVAQYPDLFKAIGTVNGGDGTNFNVPDCRTYFLTGLFDGAVRDRDAAPRTAAAPGGAIGDAVGSRQGYATAKPNAGFVTAIPHLPDDDRDVADTAVGYNLAEWNGDLDQVSISISGGDSETRPKNLSLNYYIYTGTSS